MTSFHVAFAMPVNTAEAPQRLSRGELWKGCELLVREPQVFTDAISSCTIKSDSGTRISRTLHFKSSAVSEMDQDVTLLENHKFESTTLGTGNKVTTTIFHGVTDDPFDLYLSIEYNIPYGNASSKDQEGEAFRASYTSRAKQNLVEGVATMHQLKKDGRLKA